LEDSFTQAARVADPAVNPHLAGVCARQGAAIQLKSRLLDERSVTGVHGFLARES
jgi:hypothetical protein